MNAPATTPQNTALIAAMAGTMEPTVTEDAAPVEVAAAPVAAPVVAAEVAVPAWKVEETG